MVVDDDADLLEMVTLVLTSQGMDVVALNKGKEFFNVLKSNQPDIVLMDIYLGDADGRDLCRQVKTASVPKVPILLYSAGNITSSSIAESMADDFFQKPFEINQLMKKIRNFL